MKIKKLEIANFRNIKSATYTLSDTLMFIGKNHTGKTNSIQAPCWVLTDKLIDNSSNDQSLKPIGNTKEKVSVKLTIDADDGREHTIEKTYQEKWTKTRGSEEETLTGHETIYKIDEIKIDKITQARKDIDALLQIKPEDYNIKDFNIYQAMMNPLYLADILEWKSLRSLIISIIGDATPEDIFKKEPATLPAQELLYKYDFKIENVTKLCTQQITAITKTITELEAQRELLENSVDIPADELKAISNKIDELNKEKIDLLNDNNTTNPVADAKEKEAAALNKQAMELSSKEREEYNAKRDALNDKLMAAATNKIQAIKKYDEIEKKKNDESYKLRVLNEKINFNNERLRAAKETREELIAEYRALIQDTYQPGEPVTCPNCGQVLNQDEMDKEKDAWEIKHQKAIDDNKAKGMKQKLLIEDATKTIEEAMVAREETQAAITQLNSDLADAAKRVEEETDKHSIIYKESTGMAVFTPSDKVRELKDKANSLIMESREILNRPDQCAAERNAQVELINAQIDELKKTEATHYMYLKSQEQLQEKIAEIKVQTKERIKYQTIKEAAVLFSKVKLEILDERLTAHFGNEIKWILLEKNLKEGSWDTTCYPLIIGTQTPFKNGSTSEKVMTGIKIIEVVKRELNLPDLPILIDEIGELDSVSFNKLREITKAQIIATRVDDDYDEPTPWRVGD